MAISTYQVYLVKDGVKLVDIKSFGDLGGSPETLDTTTLSDNMTTSILGIQSLEAIECECNYTPSDYEKLRDQAEEDLKVSENESLPTYGIWFGGEGVGSASTATGNKGKFDFKGRLSVHVTGGGVNEVVGMVVTIAPAEPIEFTAPTI